MSHDVTPCRCPMCGHILEEATEAVGAHSPKPNDITFCFYCAALLVFTDDMRVRVPTEEENRIFAEDAGLQNFARNLERYIGARNRN